MKRFPLLGAFLLLPAVALLVLTACSDKAKDGKTGDPTVKPGPDNKGVVKEKYKGPTDGNIMGTVKLSGAAPTIEDIKALQEFKDAKEKAFCMGGDVKEQMWVIDKNGGVANVLISLEPAAGKEFDVTDALKAPFKTPVVIKQPHCQYVPHVAAVYADIQPLHVESSAGTTHNVKMKETKQNSASNNTLTPNAKPIDRTFKYDGAPIEMRCDIHTWMTAQVFVFKHPYFAVSKDDGSFEIKSVPSGEDLVLYVWHESSGKTKLKDAYKVSKGDNSLNLEITSKGMITVK
jgi:hypothetical protein